MYNKYNHILFRPTGRIGEIHLFGIRKMNITGSATDFCVESTVQSARSKDYQVTVVKDGHTTMSGAPTFPPKH
ncbi:isochorismatase family protein [Dawidia soli]